MTPRVYAVLALALLAALAAAAAAQPPGLPLKLRGSLKVQEVNLTFIVYSDGGVQARYYARGYLEAPGLPTGLNLTYRSATQATSNKYISVLLVSALLPSSEHIRVTRASLDAKALLVIDRGVSMKGSAYVSRGGGKPRHIHYELRLTTDRVVVVVEGLSCSSKIVEALEELPGVKAECVNETLRATMDTGRFYAWLRAKGLSDQEIEAINTLLETSYHATGTLGLSASIEPAEGGVAARLEYRLGLRGDVSRLLGDLARAELPVYHAALAVLQYLAEKSGAEELAKQLSRALAALSLTAAPPKLVPQPPYQARTLLRLEAKDHRLYFEVDVLSTKLVYVGGGTPAEKAREALKLFAEELAQLKLAAGLLSAYLGGAQSLIPSVIYVKPGDPRVHVSPEKVTLDQLPRVEIRISPKPTTTTARHTATGSHTEKHHEEHEEEHRVEHTEEYVVGGTHAATRTQRGASPATTTATGTAATSGTATPTAAPRAAGGATLLYMAVAAAVGAIVGAVAAALALRRG